MGVGPAKRSLYYIMKMMKAKGTWNKKSAPDFWRIYVLDLYFKLKGHFTGPLKNEFINYS
jgi:hypothetical protein